MEQLEIMISARTWWEMRRLKYNLIVGTIGIIIVILLNKYVLKGGASFDIVFFLTSIGIAIIYALLCNLSYSLIWMLDDLYFKNELVNIHSPKRTFLLYGFCLVSCIFPFGIFHLVKDLL